MKTTTVFLDLEETVIESWNNPDWLSLKADIIREVINVLKRENTTVQLGLMSWAVWDDADKKVFNKKLREPIEQSLKLEFSDDLILSMDDWIQLVMVNSGMRLSRADVHDLSSKETILFWLRDAKHDFPTGSIILIDDAIKHDDCIISPEGDRKITMKNIDNLVKLCRIEMNVA